MNRPTREQLNALLWSDPASEAFEGDAIEILDKPRGRSAESIDRVLAVIEDVVGAETSGVALGLGGESDAEDLRDLACGAKRCAILLLHAAWFAEQEAKRPGARRRRS